jgi:hypothetical protein
MLTNSFKNATAAAGRAAGQGLRAFYICSATDHLGLQEAGWAYACVHNSGCSLQKFCMQHMPKRRSLVLCCLRC